MYYKVAQKVLWCNIVRPFRGFRSILVVALRSRRMPQILQSRVPEAYHRVRWLSNKYAKFSISRQIRIY